MSTPKKDYIKDWWGRKTLGEIAADLSISPQRVSQIGRELALGALPIGRPPNPKVSCICTGCGRPFLQTRRVSGMRKICDDCLSKKMPSIGARSYHLKRVHHETWRQIADRIGYRPGQESRGQKAMRAAKAYAARKKFTWPVPLSKPTPEKIT